MPTRRQFIQTGLIGACLLAGAGFIATPRRDRVGAPERDLRFLNARDATVLAAIVPVMLDSASHNPASVVAGVDVAVRALPLSMQSEVRRLFDLLSSAWGRRWVAGIVPPWHEASASEIAAFLRRWQMSRFTVLRSAYQALHALIMAAWYGNPMSWQAIGYARPAAVLAVLP